jgi:hypothetical protein
MEPIIKALFVRRLTNLSEDEQKLVSEAEMPALEEITPELMDDIKIAARNNIKIILQASGIFAAACVFGLLMKSYAFSFSLGVTVGAALIGAWIVHLRSAVDDTAAVMQIPVHHVDETRSGAHAVCYLPDGKYLFRVPKNEADPESVTVITCGGITQFKCNRKVVKL